MLWERVKDCADELEDYASQLRDWARWLEQDYCEHDRLAVRACLEATRDEVERGIRAVDEIFERPEH